MSLTLKIPDFIQGTDYFRIIKDLLTEAVEEIELSVHRNKKGQVVVGSNKENESDQDHFLFNDFCNYLHKTDIALSVLCFLEDDHMELEVKEIAEKHHIFDSLFLTGQINPMFIIPWDRPKVIYNIENVLPNLKSQAKLKKAHFDVLHYLCRKFSLKNICVSKYDINEEFVDLCKTNAINLSVRGDYSLNESLNLMEMGVDRVITARALPQFVEGFSHL